MRHVAGRSHQHYKNGISNPKSSPSVYSTHKADANESEYISIPNSPAYTDGPLSGFYTKSGLAYQSIYRRAYRCCSEGSQSLTFTDSTHFCHFPVDHVKDSLSDEVFLVRRTISPYQRILLHLEVVIRVLRLAIWSSLRVYEACTWCLSKERWGHNVAVDSHISFWRWSKHALLPCLPYEQLHSACWLRYSAAVLLPLYSIERTYPWYRFWETSVPQVHWKPMTHSRYKNRSVYLPTKGRRSHSAGHSGLWPLDLQPVAAPSEKSRLFVRWNIYSAALKVHWISWFWMNTPFARSTLCTDVEVTRALPNLLLVLRSIIYHGWYAPVGPQRWQENPPESVWSTHTPDHP